MIITTTKKPQQLWISAYPGECAEPLVEHSRAGFGCCVALRPRGQNGGLAGKQYGAHVRWIGYRLVSFLFFLTAYLLNVTR